MILDVRSSGLVDFLNELLTAPVGEKMFLDVNTYEGEKNPSLQYKLHTVLAGI